MSINKQCSEESIIKKIKKWFKRSVYLYILVSVIWTSYNINMHFTPKKQKIELTYSQIWNRQKTMQCIREWSQFYGVPLDHALAMKKSENDKGKSNAVSKEQAVGLFQALPSTFYSLMPEGKHVSHVPDNIEFAMMYISKLHSQYKDWDMAWSAYNSGDPYGYRKFNETRVYVAKCRFYTINGTDALFTEDMRVASLKN